MNHLVDVALFTVFIAFLLWISRPAPLLPTDVQVWSDETERRLLAGSTRRHT
jgi:hypothetical protein